MRFLPALLLFAAASCAAPAKRPLPSPTTLLAANADPADAAALDAFYGADYVVIGEAHDQACDHRAQAELIDRLAVAGRAPAVALEMIDVDYQPVLDRFLQGSLSIDELADALEWEKRWGIPFSLYRPIFEVASTHDLPLIALNLPRTLTRRVGRVGLDGLSEEERVRLPSITPASEAQRVRLRKAWEAHAHAEGAGEEGFARFLLVQALWDSQMAARAVQARLAHGGPIVVLAGAGHVAFGQGIPERIAAREPASLLVTVLPWRGGEAPAPSSADLFVYCPAEGSSTP